MRTSLIIIASATLVLAGCAAPVPNTAGDGAAPPASGGSAEGGCPTDLAGYELFSSDLVTKAPETGAVYGDGSTLSFTLAMGAGYYPTLDLSYLNDAGTPVILGGQNLQDEGDGVYSNNLNVFDSDADGRPGFASVTVVKDDTFDAPAGQEGAAQPILGRYCVTFAVE